MYLLKIGFFANNSRKPWRIQIKFYRHM